MGTVYSEWSAGWKPSGSSVYKTYRARLDWSVAWESDTQICYSFAVYAQLNSSVNCTVWAVIDGNASSSVRFVFSESPNTQLVQTRSVTWNKGETARNEYINGYASSSSGKWTGVSYGCTATCYIPAKRYSFSFNANDGSGAPAEQKKVHNTALALPTTIPTRAGYDFVEWNTAADGTGDSYASGGTVPAGINQITVLYAQWHMSYIPPSIENLRAYRTLPTITGRNPAVKSNGTRCYADFTYLPPPQKTETVTNSIVFSFGEYDIAASTGIGGERYAYTPWDVDHLPVTQKETVIVTITVTDYLGNEYEYKYATYISSENYVFDAFKDTQDSEEYFSFALGGIARDFSNSNRSPKGNFDIYMDMSIVLNNCTITDSGTALSVTKGASTDDGKLAQAVIDAFDYQTAKEILEV